MMEMFNMQELLKGKMQQPRPNTRSLPMVMECKHFGKLLDRTGCGLEVYSCRKHGACSWQHNAGVKHCDRCGDYSSSSATWRRIHLDERTIAASRGGKRYNASMIPWNDGYLLAYRASWEDADIEIVTLDADYKETMQAKPLRLGTIQALAGREDPRLFLYRGKPHIWYTGWQGGYTDTPDQATVHYAEIDPVRWKVVSKHWPKIPWKRNWEKNHAYFDRGGELYSVYSIYPHRVMRIRGDTVAEDWTTHFTPTQNNYGHLRGGASPWMHKGEFYHFFHYMTEAHGYRLYSIGVYTFSTDPPFPVRRMSIQPIDVADVNRTKLIDVLFPAGAFPENGNWVVTMGVHDEFSQVRYYPESYIEKSLVPV